jgi:hypothetical protein
MTTPDIYDDAINYLVAHPEEYRRAWSNGAEFTTHRDIIAGAAGAVQFVAREFPGSALFRVCQRGRVGERLPRKDWCGCLSEIHAGLSTTAYDCNGDPALALADEIRTDSRLAAFEDSTDFEALSLEERRAHLQPFAEWQRRLDTELLVPPPVEVAHE